MVRCETCGFQVVVPPRTIQTLDVVGQLTLSATRIINLSPDTVLPLCRCAEVAK